MTTDVQDKAASSVGSGLRVNLDCAGAYLEGWLNVDDDPRVRADAHEDPFDFISIHGADITELFLGYLLEDLDRDDAIALLRLISSRCPIGTAVTAVATDVRAVSSAFLKGDIDAQAFNSVLVHASGKGRQQRWSYDGETLLELLREAGIDSVAAMAPATLPDSQHQSGAPSKWRCSATGTVGRRKPVDGTPGPDGASRMPRPEADRSRTTPSTDEMVLRQLEAVRAELERVRSREQAALRRAGDADRLAGDLLDTRHTLEQINSSITFRVAHRGSLGARQLLPAGPRRRALASRLARVMSRQQGGDAGET